MAESRKQTTSKRIQFDDEYDGHKLRQLEQQVAIQAESIRRLERLLLGGTTGQVLTKTSNRDFEGDWQTPA